MVSTEWVNKLVRNRCKLSFHFIYWGNWIDVNTDDWSKTKVKVTRISLTEWVNKLVRNRCKLSFHFIYWGNWIDVNTDDWSKTKVKVTRISLTEWVNKLVRNRCKLSFHFIYWGNWIDVNTDDWSKTKVKVTRISMDMEEVLLMFWYHICDTHLLAASPGHGCAPGCPPGYDHDFLLTFSTAHWPLFSCSLVALVNIHPSEYKSWVTTDFPF